MHAVAEHTIGTCRTRQS